MVGSTEDKVCGRGWGENVALGSVVHGIDGVWRGLNDSCVGYHYRQYFTKKTSSIHVPVQAYQAVWRSASKSGSHARLFGSIWAQGLLPGA